MLTIFSTPSMKLCRDCKHFLAEDGTRLEYGKCLREYNEDQISAVTGQVIVPAGYSYAETCRRLTNLCGRDGKWWEPKS